MSLESDCADKDALLSELSHRVRNHLSSLMSLALLQMNLALLQMNIAKSEETRDALSGLANRIQVFGDVYRRLNVDAVNKVWDCPVSVDTENAFA